MQKLDQINRARSLLSSALGVALNSMPNNHSIQDARMHMKKALNELDNAAKTQTQKKTNQDYAKNWWGNVVSGVAAQPVSQEAQNKSLAQLNKMIDSQQAILDGLDQNTITPDDDDLLSD